MIFYLYIIRIHVIGIMVRVFTNGREIKVQSKLSHTKDSENGT